MAVRGGAGHGKSGPLMAKGCFLLVVVVLLLLLLLLDGTHAFAARQPSLALDNNNNNNNKSVKFRGSRAAFTYPTAIVLSPPNKNLETPQQPSEHLSGSRSSSFPSPGGVSSSPSTHGQLDQHSRGMPSMATPAVTPGPFTLRPHTWRTGDRGFPSQSTGFVFGQDRAHLRPASADWSRNRNPTLMEGGVGWSGMKASPVQTRWPRTQHTPGSGSPFARHDTFGHQLREDLSHRQDRPMVWGQEISEGDSSVGEWDRRGPVISEETPHQTNIWPINREVEEEEVNDEDERSMFDFNATSEYQPDDYNAYHEYDHSNTSWRPSEHDSQDRRILTFQHVMKIQNLASQADLHAMLDQRGITFDELRAFLKTGARKKDVIEFLKAPTPSTTIVTTTPSPPVHSYPPRHHETSVVEEGYQGDITRHVSLPEKDDDDTDQINKEQSRKGRKKGRQGKGGGRKNKKRKGKKRQKEGASDVTSSSPSPPMNDTTQTPEPVLWVPNTPRLPGIISTTDATKGILMPTTHSPTPNTKTTSPSSVKTSIVSVTMMKATFDPEPQTPIETTFVEAVPPPRRQNTHIIPDLREEEIPMEIPRPATPSPEFEQTINEIERVNFVREKQRDDYVFPLRGLLIISGLMGALAVFTLVVLISYAVIKCSKKPVVNNYQVSQQQKPAGT
ncbi:uncharacterized protein LOC135109899 isoform X1 [Scylla paramamosain]|uniref:uncharacterized protein LOC135109899 isoform X1 n=1 Tax=Scylla paramamosain TaxID=85552 RepID=UPI003082BAF2